MDTNIYLIIDGSGSMGSVKHDVVTGINDFITEQKAEVLKSNDTTKLSLTVFDSNINQVIDGEDITLVDPVDVSETFLGGGTALLDAIGKTLTTAKEAARNLVVIYTDGEENQSTEFKHKDIEKLIKKLDKNGKWQFIYLGAEFGAFQKDQAFTAVASAGASTSSLNTSKQSVTGTFANVSKTANYHRSATPDQYTSLNARGGLVASATQDAAVDWDSVKEKTDDNESK